MYQYSKTIEQNNQDFKQEFEQAKSQAQKDFKTETDKVFAELQEFRSKVDADFKVIQSKISADLEVTQNRISADLEALQQKVSAQVKLSSDSFLGHLSEEVKRRNRDKSDFMVATQKFGDQIMELANKTKSYGESIINMGEITGTIIELMNIDNALD